jgi:acyl-activating enzyme 14
MVLDRKALGAIRLSLSKSVAFNIKGQKIATNLMKALSNLYEQPSAARKIHLIKKLVNLKMSENQSFNEHLNVFNEVINGLNSVSIVFDDEVLAGIILGQMPESWSTTCQSIANSFGKEKLAFQQVVDMIMTQEIRMREEGLGASSSALNMEGRESRNRNRNKNQRGKSKSRGRSKSKNHQCNNSGNQQ